MLEVLILLSITFGILIYIIGIRRKAITTARQLLARDWISEGDIHSTEAIYFTLQLENTGSNLIGSITTNTHNKLLGVYANVGWFKTTLTISELMDNNTAHAITTATLKLASNSKLEWSIHKIKNTNLLPIKAILWPCSKTPPSNSIILNKAPINSNPGKQINLARTKQ